MRSKKRAKYTKKIQKRAKKATKKPKTKQKRKLRRKTSQNVTQKVYLSGPDFKALQKTWYDKLKETGFVDLESQDLQDGLLNNKGSQALARIAKAYSPLKETYYRRLTNYVTHNPNWSNDKFKNLIARLYVDGVSYRKMLPKLAKLGKVTSIWSVHKVIKQLELKSNDWNKRHPEGLDFVSDFDTLKFSVS